MAESICPFCGKTNPEEAEFCQFCKARLVPSSGTSYEDESSTQDVSEWLKRTSPSVPGDKEQESPQKTEEKPPEETPDWLERVRERSRLEQESKTAEESVIPASREEQAIPDWLQEIKDGNQKPTNLEEEPHEVSQPPSVPLPSLKEEDVESAEKGEVATPVEKKGRKKEGASEEIGRIIEKVKEEEKPGVPPAEKPPEKPGEASSLPAYPLDYSKPFHTEDLRELAHESIDSDAESPVNREETPKDGNAPKLPDWLKELEVNVPPEPVGIPPQEEQPSQPISAQPVQTPPAQGEQGESQPFTGGELPEWLAKLSPPGTFAGETLPSPAFKEEGKENEPLPSPPVESPFPSSNLPDWMKEKTKQDTKQSQPSKEEAAETPELEPAQLPPWMQAMRPIESIVPDHLQNIKPTEEGSGPLAGISDTLPGLGAIGTYQKPPVLTGKLNVSERQRNHADVLESMLEREPKPSEAEEASQKKRGKAFRTIMSLLMLAVLCFLVISGFEVAPLPLYYPNSVITTHTFFQNLPSDSLILLVVDYEPALQGELTQASLALVEQLMAKGCRMAIISTNSNGPVLAQNLLDQAQSKHPEYALDQHVINLGWLPGGATGLQNFARLSSVEVQYTWQEQAVGDASPILRNTLNLQIFHAVVILTDNAEIGRLWIEQVLPTIQQIPTFMVTSALAGPLLQPYFESGQLQGLISGIEGGLIYSQQANLPGMAGTYWSTYQVGLAFSLAIMLMGGIFKLTGLRSRKAKSVAEEKE